MSASFSTHRVLRGARNLRARGIARSGGQRNGRRDGLQRTSCSTSSRAFQRMPPPRSRKRAAASFRHTTRSAWPSRRPTRTPSPRRLPGTTVSRVSCRDGAFSVARRVATGAPRAAPRTSPGPRTGSSPRRGERHLSPAAVGHGPDPRARGARHHRRQPVGGRRRHRHRARLHASRTSRQRRRREQRQLRQRCAGPGPAAVDGRQRPRHPHRRNHRGGLERHRHRRRRAEREDRRHQGRQRRRLLLPRGRRLRVHVGRLAPRRK